MALINCEECGKQISDRATSCPSCGAPVDITALPSAQPKVDSQLGHKVQNYRSYSEVPWYRRSSVNSAFIIVGVGSKGVVPLTLITCYLVLTGKIYYNN
ncbi:zinc-ribbon domain-containing protein [Geobacter argillaceus]|uniref:zinc-ribbon domain-containing protein n=1 Tax=Geobacter argillaceus TaxID=345631 RepID=UPI0011A97DAF